VVTEAAVKQHLLRLYQKFRIPEGPNRRVRLANEVVALGLVRPLPPASRPSPTPAPRATQPRGGPAAPSGPSVPAPRSAGPGAGHPRGQRPGGGVQARRTENQRAS